MENTLTKYEVVIGLEIHIQLDTKSKMFCRCDNNSDNAQPNTNVCPICMGFPGTLPVANRQAILWGTKTALALGCQINPVQRFDRKNYFYPDLPKGYQISQFFFPVGEHGRVEIDYLASDRKTKVEFGVGITRLHLEEDAGKLLHDAERTLVDLNRCGTPLMEIVTEPDIKSPEQARAFLQELQRIVRNLGVSKADMEKGHLRVDGNISLMPVGSTQFGAKVEVKNINSFKFLEQALKYEIQRQTEQLEKGALIIQETRGWDEKRNITVSQRVKEGSVDYRYFPEPDLPPIVVDDTVKADAALNMAQLPKAMRSWAEERGLAYSRVAELQDMGVLPLYVTTLGLDTKMDPTLLANWIGKTFNEHMDLAKFMTLLTAHGFSNTQANKLYDLVVTQGQPTDVAVLAVNSEKAIDLEPIVAEVLIQNQDLVDRIVAGETKLTGALMGKIMQKTAGQAEPAEAQAILNRLLTK